MPQLASWIRETDQGYFQGFFDLHPGLQVHNARVESVDPNAMEGVLITGGPDVAAEFHPIPPQDQSLILEPDPVRDAWEFAAVHAAIDRGLPLLCICKGMQVLNLALGGSLRLDIRGHDLPEMRSSNVQPLRYDHSAKIQFATVNSSHHQALDQIAAPLVVEAWHAGDGVVEQVRLPSHPWAVGVQYHPERDLAYLPLFEAFFAHLPGC